MKGLSYHKVTVHYRHWTWRLDIRPSSLTSYGVMCVRLCCNCTPVVSQPPKLWGFLDTGRQPRLNKHYSVIWNKKENGFSVISKVIFSQDATLNKLMLGILMTIAGPWTNESPSTSSGNTQQPNIAIAPSYSILLNCSTKTFVLQNRIIIIKKKLELFYSYYGHRGHQLDTTGIDCSPF